MAYEFQTPATGSLRVDVNLDEDGNIATGGAEVAGAKSMTFSSVSATATAEDFAAVGSAMGGSAGLLRTFFGYLLGGSAITSSMRRTLIQTVREVA